MTVSSVNDLKILYDNPAFQNRYLLSINPIGGESFDVFCDSVTMPGKQVLSVDRRIGTSFQKVAYGYATPDISASFLVSDDHWIPLKLKEWQHQAVFGKNQNGYHVPSYQDEYVKDITIHQLDKKGNKLLGVKLVKAYPTTVNSMEFSNAGESQILRITCEFSYHRFYDINPDGKEAGILPLPNIR